MRFVCNKTKCSLPCCKNIAFVVFIITFAILLYYNKLLGSPKYQLPSLLKSLGSSKTLGNTHKTEARQRELDKGDKYILEYFDNQYKEPIFGYRPKRSDVVDSGRQNTVCSEKPPALTGRIKAEQNTLKPPNWNAIAEAHPWLTIGGSFKPTNCSARHKVAIIIPLRDRDWQLRLLISRMHKIWRRQQIDYTVYVITQTGEKPFNRAKLMNIGFSESLKDREYDCFVFHDVDLILENDHCLYWCTEDGPIHLAMHVDSRSKEMKQGLNCRSPEFEGIMQNFGGVTMLTRKQFEDVNGFSNLYWGRDGENVDLYVRTWKKGYSVKNQGKSCSYHMINDEHEVSETIHTEKNSLLFHTISRMDREGLNSLRYKVVSREKFPSYTNITADIGIPTKVMEQFLSNDGGCDQRMPWEELEEYKKRIR